MFLELSPWPTASRTNILEHPFFRPLETRFLQPSPYFIRYIERPPSTFTRLDRIFSPLVQVAVTCQRPIVAVVWEFTLCDLNPATRSKVSLVHKKKVSIFHFNATATGGNRPVSLLEESRPVRYRAEETADVYEVESAFPVCPLALCVVYFKPNVWWNPGNSCQGGSIESSPPGGKGGPSHTIPVVLEISLSLSVSYVYSMGSLPSMGIWIITGSNDLANLCPSAS